MAKASSRPGLADAVSKVSGSTRRNTAPMDAPLILDSAGEGPSSRQGTKMVAGHFPPDVSWQLRALAVERRSTVQALLAEALNDLFAKHRKPEIAPTQ